ncbi:MAG: hypothetical protein VYB34_12865 [Planctomycetota bacterium]|nr:hypothetical protein [Planctomycetota bacterium]
MKTVEVLIVIGSILHFLTLIAAALVPGKLNWKEELAKLAPFLRSLFWVYGAFIFLCITALGTISAVNYQELAAGGTLARSFCAFTAVFWGLRLFAGLFVFDASEYLTSWFYKAGYHGLTLVFIYQAAVYGYCAFAPGIN